MKTCPKMKKIISKLASKHAINLDEPSVLLRLEMPGFDQLRIEHLPNGCISVAHVYQVEGFLVPEPDVCFFIGQQGEWIPVNITQSLTGYRNVAQLNDTSDAILRYSRQAQAELANFCEQWAANLVDQQWLENATPYQLPEHHLFDLGQIVATPGALEALKKTGQTADEFISRHVSGDWGTLPAEDVQANEEAVKSSGRLLSAYYLNDSTKIWLITEWDRSATTLLLPNEY